MGRKRLRSVWDQKKPGTRWAEERRERELFVLLFGEGKADTAIEKWRSALKEHPEYWKSKHFTLNVTDIDAMADINQMYHMGLFKNIPDPVAKRLLRSQSHKYLYDPDALADPKNLSAGWSTSALVSMGLECLRLYLMGIDPYMRRVLRNIIKVTGETITMDQVVLGIEDAAAADDALEHLEYEDDDDFDFSSIEDLDF